MKCKQLVVAGSLLLAAQGAAAAGAVRSLVFGETRRNR
jgi:hypothetical protein